MAKKNMVEILTKKNWNFWRNHFSYFNDSWEFIALNEDNDLLVLIEFLWEMVNYFKFILIEELFLFVLHLKEVKALVE